MGSHHPVQVPRARRPGLAAVAHLQCEIYTQALPTVQLLILGGTTFDGNTKSPGR